MRPELYAAATKAGAFFYGNPLDLLKNRGAIPIDPLIEPAVLAINRSGWVWTAESCSGHPDSTSQHCWAGNVEPMLRFVTQAHHVALFFELLMEATYSPGSIERAAAQLGKAVKDLAEADQDVVRAQDEHGVEGHCYGLRVYPRKLRGPWFEVLVYVVVQHTVFDRNQGLKVFERFGALAQKVANEKPEILPDESWGEQARERLTDWPGDGMSAPGPEPGPEDGPEDDP